MIDKSRIAGIFAVPEVMLEGEVGLADQARANRADGERLIEAARLSEPLLSLADVAGLLGISVAAARRIPATELPFSRVTARNDRRYERPDVVRYVDSRKEGGQ